MILWSCKVDFMIHYIVSLLMIFIVTWMPTRRQVVVANKKFCQFLRKVFPPSTLFLQFSPENVHANLLVRGIILRISVPWRGPRRVRRRPCGPAARPRCIVHGREGRGLEVQEERIRRGDGVLNSNISSTLFRRPFFVSLQKPLVSRIK